MVRSIQQTLLGLITIIRPINVAITVISVVIGGVIAGGDDVASDAILWIAGLSAGLIAAGGNALNDYYDRAIDRVNRRKRPIPAGKAAPRVAFGFGLLLLGAGIVTGSALGVRLGLVAFLVSGLLWLYSARLKRTPLFGNIIVAMCAAATLLYGSLAVQQQFNGLIPTLFAFMIHLAREIVKDCEDMRGDRVARARTLPLMVGTRRAQNLVGVILILLTTALPFPYLTGMMSLTYLIVAAIMAGAPMMVVAITMFDGLERAGLRRASLTLKLCMVGGLISLYVG